MKRVIEVTLSVNNLEVRLLFDAEPRLVDVCNAIKHVFKDNDHVREGLCTLVTTLEDEDFRLGDEGFFTNDEGKIGAFFVQPRTIFEV